MRADPREWYNLFDMSWKMRASTALALALAVFALPLMLDLCDASCEAHRARASTSAPACHHSSPVTTRIERVPNPCGHDHNGTVITSTAESASTQRPCPATMAVVANQITGEPATAATRTSVEVENSPHDPLSHQLSAALRI
jgi:hypothetical protein